MPGWALPLLAASLASSWLQPAMAKTLPSYRVGDAIPVSCVNRSIETGEHLPDEDGRLQYIPFPACKETGKPLQLYFGKEHEFNCTIEFVDDDFFHLLQFYVHNDAPMTCRIPARPLVSNAPSTNMQFTPDEAVGAFGAESSAFVPFNFALSGVLQLSHLHVANNLNVLLHAAPRRAEPGVVNSAIAYSHSHATKTVRVVIGDELPLRLSVRWYPTPVLPSGWQGVGGHLTATTLLYCLLCAGASAAVCIAYFRGVELPRRLRTHGRDRLGLFSRATSRELPVASSQNGYGVGITTTNGLNGYGYGYSTGTIPGKFD